MKIDIIIQNGLVICVDKNLSVFENGAIAINKGEIIDVGQSHIISEKYLSAHIIDASNKLVMPGIINTHTHTGNTIYRGVADDMPLKKWLEEYIFPLEAKFCNQENVRLSAQLSIIEMLRSGTTTFSDMYYFEDEVAKVAKETGIRCELGETLLNFPVASAKSYIEGLNYSENLLKTWNNDPLITVAITPHAPYTCNDEILKKAKSLADKYGVSFHLHVSESEWEVNKSRSEHGATPVEYLNNLGVLDNNSLAVHCVHLSKHDKEILAKNKVSVSHNPQSNMKLSSGVAPIQDLIDMGVLVGLGTDGAASNNNLNMFKEMDIAAKLQKVHTRNPVSLNAKTMVEMVTINGAKILKLENKVGSIEKGKRADIILIDINQSQLIPMYDPYSHIVYAMNGSEVHTVIVDGKILMENRSLKTIDEEKVLYEVKKLSEKIKTQISKNKI